MGNISVTQCQSISPTDPLAWMKNSSVAATRLQTQARLIAAYEESKWPRRPPSTGNLIRHLMDQHDLTRADMVPILGTPSRVSEVLGGKKGLSMAMVQRLQDGFGSPRFQLPMLHRSAKLAFADLPIVRTVKSSQANGVLRDTHAISE